MPTSFSSCQTVLQITTEERTCARAALLPAPAPFKNLISLSLRSQFPIWKHPSAKQLRRQHWPKEVCAGENNICDSPGTENQARPGPDPWPMMPTISDSESKGSGGCHGGELVSLNGW